MSGSRDITYYGLEYWHNQVGMTFVGRHSVAHTVQRLDEQSVAFLLFLTHGKAR